MVNSKTSSTGCVSDLDLDLFDGVTGGNPDWSWSSTDNVEQVGGTVNAQAVVKVKPYWRCRTPEPFALASSVALVPASGPQLTVASCSAPSSVPAGSSFTLACTIQNTGDLTAFSVSGSLRWAGGTASSQSYGTLAPSASAARSWNVTAPVSPGSYQLILDASSDSYEMAFTATRTMNVSVTPPATPPQMAALSPATPIASSASQTLTVHGSGFQTGLTVTLISPSGSSSTISGSQIQNVSSTSFQANVVLNAPGAWGIRVNNPDGGQSGVFYFAVVSGTCEYGISTSSLSVPASGGTISVRINTASGCAWSVSGLPAWLSASATTGAGPATLALTALVNSGAPRTASLTIAGVKVAVRQLDNTACGGASSCVIRPLTHLAYGGEWATTLTMANPSAQPATFQASFYSSSGASVALPFTGGIGSQSTLSGSAPSQGLRYYEAQDPSGTTRSAWALVTAPETLSVHATFRRNPHGTVFYEAAVFSGSGYSSFIPPFDATTFAPASAQMFTGIAINNLDPSRTATVTCLARDQDGNLIAGGALPIPVLNPMGHWAGYDFPALAGKRGVLKCTADSLVSALALKFIGYEAFSTIPVNPQ